VVCTPVRGCLLCRFHVSVSVSRFHVTRDNTGCVPRTSEVEVRYVQDDGTLVATPDSPARPKRPPARGSETNDLELTGV